MKLNRYQLITIGLVSLTICSGLVLTSTKSYADNDSATDDVNITVPVACTMTGTIATGQEHTATLQPGTYSGASGSGYENGIGKTTLATFCNDYNGFSIYAIGYTGNVEGNNTLVGINTSSTINTKAYESTDTTSNWSMKVNKVTDSSATFNPANMTITNSFDSWHTVPDDYTKVAEYHASTGSSATDQSLGAKVETTYATFVSTTQPADTYTGKVKYVMVHPNDATAPVKPADPISQCTTPIPNVKYMQDVTDANLSYVLSSMEMNQQYYLRDKRDETPYCVAKLDDGSTDGTIWMTQNLRIQGTISASLSNFTGSDLNISQYDLKTNGITGGECYGSNGYNNVCSHIAESTEVPSGKTTEDIGVWYNYMAATAGTISGSSNTTEATSDICPSNWHLPNYNTNKPAGSINSLFGSTILRDVFSPVAGGYYSNGSIVKADNGYWWSSTAESSTYRHYRYYLHYTGSGLDTTSYHSSLNRSNGEYIRCVR